MKQNKKTIGAFIGGMILMALVTLPVHNFVYALVSPPDSGENSRLETLYNSLVSIGNGSDSSGSWGNWGSMWNRIRSSSEWTPSGDATAGDVVTGKMFYGDGRAEQTGTLVVPETIDYSLQQYNEYDNYEGPEGNGELVGDYVGDESVWINTLPLSEGNEVWQDSRTGLYWSNSVGIFYNSFPDQDHSSCEFFSNLRSDYDGTNENCGDAINACGLLELDGDNDGTLEGDWYLPTINEFLQANLDGMFNQTRTDFTTINTFWTSTEASDNSSDAWYGVLNYPDVWNIGKANPRDVRCVRRD